MAVFFAWNKPGQAGINDLFHLFHFIPQHHCVSIALTSQQRLVRAKMKTSKPTSSSIADFCERHGISEPTFYRHRPEMPRAIKIGGQWRIPDKSETEWLEAAYQSPAVQAA